MKVAGPPLASERLLDQVRERIRYLHYSLKTVKAYLYWVGFFALGSARQGGMRYTKKVVRCQCCIDVRPVQKLQGRCDVSSTMIFTKALKAAAGGAASSLDVRAGHCSTALRHVAYA